jgi:hypothetical protein
MSSEALDYYFGADQLYTYADWLEFDEATMKPPKRRFRFYRAVLSNFQRSLLGMPEFYDGILLTM